MPLNDDPNTLSDGEYWSRWQRAVDEQGGTPSCGDAPPADLVADLVANLDGETE